MKRNRSGKNDTEMRYPEYQTGSRIFSVRRAKGKPDVMILMLLFGVCTLILFGGEMLLSVLMLMAFSFLLLYVKSIIRR